MPSRCVLAREEQFQDQGGSGGVGAACRGRNPRLAEGGVVFWEVGKGLANQARS